MSTLDWLSDGVRVKIILKKHECHDTDVCIIDLNEFTEGLEQP